MKIINLIPGSPEWLQSRSASKAPAMMGDSTYQSRNELLRQMATGIIKEIDAPTQARFDNGHRTETLSRVIAEEIIGEELSPISASDDDGYLTANFDGITFSSRIGYEHKDWNEKLAASVRDGVVPNSHAWQLDQQILVGNLDYILFVVSDGTKDNFAKIEYRSTKERAEALMAGWRQFDIDLANYRYVEQPVKPKAEAILDLPALSVQATGMVTYSNLPEFKKAAENYIANINTDLQTDQNFADAEATVKFCKATEEKLEVTKAAILAQTATIDDVIRTVDHIQAQLRDKRLLLDKLVKSEKEARKFAIITKARENFNSHFISLEEEIKPIRLIALHPDFGGAIKGLKSLSSMQEAVDTVLRNGKFDADMIAKDIRTKLVWMNECWFNSGGNYVFLFADLQQIISKPMDDFKLLIQSRIKDHKEAEARKEAALIAKAKADAVAKLEAEQTSMRAEAEAKTTEQRAAQQASIDAEVQAIDAELQTKAKKDATLQDNNCRPVHDNIVVIEHQDKISAFLASRDFDKEAGKARAILIEFIKFSATHGRKAA